MIGQLKQRLTERGALMAAMSGSGSTVFGVFKSARGRQPRGARVDTDGARVITARFLPLGRTAKRP